MTLKIKFCIVMMQLLCVIPQVSTLETCYNGQVLVDFYPNTFTPRAGYYCNCTVGMRSPLRYNAMNQIDGKLCITCPIGTYSEGGSGCEGNRITTPTPLENGCIAHIPVSIQFCLILVIINFVIMTIVSQGCSVGT